jgi:hypothetical protein
VQYCAEQFPTDNAPMSAVMKSLKRAMAGEYSRELSAKIFAGQCRLITLGFRQGGPPGYGLRRQLLDQSGKPKAMLSPGERKSFQMERVILTPGPELETATVRRIYDLFTVGLQTELQIATTLNAEGIVSGSGGNWTRGAIHALLINEKYIGNNLYNRVSTKLQCKRVINGPECFDSLLERRRLRILNRLFFAVAKMNSHAMISTHDSTNRERQAFTSVFTTWNTQYL